jgi:signal transduction histidine kinase
MSLRTRFALLYAVVFFVSAVIVVSVPLLAVRDTVHSGSSGPGVVTHPDHLSAQTIAITLGISAAVSVGIGWLLAGRLLRPLRLITATAREISASNLSRRLRPGRRDDEFTLLGQTLNDLFGRLESSFASQRRFVASASHELRTPLTAERALLQVALADPDADAASLREACEQVLALGEQTERLIDALLTLATGERGLASGSPFDLADVAGHVVSSADIRADLAPAPVSGDPRLAESLIANLVSNGLRYNVPGGWVAVSTGMRDGAAIVSVSNTGPVVPADEIDRLFQPFQRINGDRTAGSAGNAGSGGTSAADGGGHGLGLAIVRAIADAHGATVTAIPRPSGGLDVTVAFP